MKPSTGQECTEIEEYISKCSVCNAYQHKQQKEPMIQHPVPARPWQFVAADLFEFQGKEYLVTMDYYSNFFEVDKLSSQTSREVIDKLKCQMARHGIPDTLRSDNGPQFSSQEFRKFSELYEFDHTTSSPAYPQSNGKAENSVKTASLILLKALEAESDPTWDCLISETPLLRDWACPQHRDFSVVERRPSYPQLAVSSTRLMPTQVKQPSSYKLGKTDSLSTTTLAPKHSNHWKKEM